MAILLACDALLAIVCPSLAHFLSGREYSSLPRWDREEYCGLL
jgi:hypothetical protein